MPKALAIQRMQDRMARAVGSRSRSLDRRFAELFRHATKGSLIDAPVFCPAERHAEMLKLINGFRCVPAQILDRILVAQPVRSLHSVVHVPAPVVRFHVAKRR